MIVTVFSFFMSVLFSTSFILAIHFLRNNAVFLRSFGAHTILALYALCLFRTIFVLELPFTVPVELRYAYSTAFETAWTAHISIGESKVHLLLVLCGMWAVVSVTLIVQFVWKNRTVAWKAEWYSANKNSYAEQIMERVKSESWRKPMVSVCVCPTLDSPMGTGLLRHRIFLPEREYTREEMYYILKHEYTHFCNQDLTIKFLVHLFCCIFWWNPAVYLLKRDISQIIEIKCDIKATEEFCKREKLEYLFTIIRVLDKADDTNRKPPSILATGLVCRKEGDDLRERFRILTSVVYPISRLCQGAFWALAVAIFVLSYSFVLQPAFDPPVEDIYTDSSVQEWNEADCSIIKDSLGRYYMVFVTGEKYEIEKIVAETFIAEGTDFKEDLTQ